MKYIVKNIVNLVITKSPSSTGETMIRVNGFEDIKIYESIAQKLKEYYSKTGLSLDIKLARNKWEFFRNTSQDSSCLQMMEQQGWIAEDESITHYRNLHQSNILVLFGTEDEEDTGGLLNCFTITPEILVKEIDGKYHKVMSNCLENIDSDSEECIDKLYKDLFEFVAIDITKLSKIADDWQNSISSLNEFVEKFYETLPSWGLPFKKLELPDSRDIKSNRNILRTEYNFISRTLFKKMSNAQFNKYKAKIFEYDKNGEEYSSGWSGWNNQGIKNFESFSKILEGYIRGEDIKKHKQMLQTVDFSIIESVLDMKLPTKVTPQKKTVEILRGEPIEAFATALLYFFADKKSIETNSSQIKIEIILAEIVSLYTDVEIDDEREQLNNVWSNICRHVNGIFEYLNKRCWVMNSLEVDIQCYPEKILSPSNSIVFIDDGLIKVAGANQINHKINFAISLVNENNGILSKEELVFQWIFDPNSSWLHSFSDICQQEFAENKGYNNIPIATIDRMKPILFSKSEEEFFDLYNESKINFEFDLSKHVDSHTAGSFREYSVRFEELGKVFCSFCYEIAQNGLYNCLKKDNSELLILVRQYNELANYLLMQTIPENYKWLIDAFIHAFNIEHKTSVVENGEDSEYCIVPPWHPATLQKINDQKIFFLDGCVEWWRNICETGQYTTKKSIDAVVYDLMQMSMVQSSLDIFPTSGQYFGSICSYGSFSLYSRTDVTNNSRLKDIINKDAVFDDDFDNKQFSRMNDNSRMIFGVITDYVKAFPETYNNLSFVFIDPSELQPIIAALHKYVEIRRTKGYEDKISIQLKILVKPENKGGRNYLSHWMDELFSQDANVNIKTYLNEWSSKNDLDKLLNGNHDIVFVMDLLKVSNLQFIKDQETINHKISDCLFPIVYKPTPVSHTTVKRRIELSQQQFSAAYSHTQLVRYRNNLEILPTGKYIAVREVSINRESQDIVHSLHYQAYWVVCVDSGMDGGLLKNDEIHKNDYSIIGFSTGKGAFGQYNLTVTARKSIIDTIRNRLRRRLYQLFLWDESKIKKAVEVCLTEASELDGISLLSAINQKDHNINDFMAYVLTSIREKENSNDSALKTVIHLDSYKHWFSGEIENDSDDSSYRPDFLVLETQESHDGRMHLKATIVECKISTVAFSDNHKKKAIKQVEYGLKILSDSFNPKSKSIKRRYWYAQLYRALAFSQITFSDNSIAFAKLSSQLRSILDGNFEIEWNGVVLGYWLDMLEDSELVSKSISTGIIIYDIPQKRIQRLLLSSEDSEIDYVPIEDSSVYIDEELMRLIEKREHEVTLDFEQVINSSNGEEQSISNDGFLTAREKVNNIDQKNILDDLDIKDRSDDIIGIQVISNAGDMSPENDIPEIASSENEGIEKLDLKNARVLIGKDKSSVNVYWEFGNNQLANRHILITGTSGQGKTYGIQTMLYELMKSNISSVIFDYTEGFRFDQLEKQFIEKLGEKIIQNVIYFEGVPINPFKRHIIEVAGIKAPEKISDVSQRIANIFAHVYGFKEQQFSALYEACRIGIEKNGKNMNMSFFKEELGNSDNKAAKTVLSKMAPFFDSIEFTSEKDFDWSKVLYAEGGLITIFQLTNFVREIQVIVTELMLWDAWHYTKKYGDKEKPFVVVLDEAQNLSHKADSPSAMILTEGRKFGWSSWFATQSVKVLSDDEVVRLLQAAFKLYFKPTDDEITRISKQLDPSNANNWLSALKSLKKGQCIVVGDRIKQDGKFGMVKPTVTSVVAFDERND
jgi:hypothetical protein